MPGCVYFIGGPCILNLQVLRLLLWHKSSYISCYVLFLAQNYSIMLEIKIQFRYLMQRFEFLF